MSNDTTNLTNVVTNCVDWLAPTGISRTCCEDRIRHFMFSWRHVVRVVSLPPCFVLECLHGYPTCVQLQDLLRFVTVAFSRNFFFRGSSRGNPRWMEKLECLPTALMFPRKILLKLTRLCNHCSSSTAGVFASYSGNEDDAQLAISCSHQQRTIAVYQHVRVCSTCRQNYCRSSPLSFCGDVSSEKKSAPTPRWHSCL